MIGKLSKTHIQWMLEDMKERENAREDDNFHNYSYRDVSKALKDYFGADDNYCALFYFVDKKTLMVLYEKQWIRIYYEQLKIFL